MPRRGALQAQGAAATKGSEQRRFGCEQGPQCMFAALQQVGGAVDLRRSQSPWFYFMQGPGNVGHGDFQLVPLNTLFDQENGRLGYAAPGRGRGGDRRQAIQVVLMHGQVPLLSKSETRCAELPGLAGSRFQAGLADGIHLNPVSRAHWQTAMGRTRWHDPGPVPLRAVAQHAATA